MAANETDAHAGAANDMTASTTASASTATSGGSAFFEREKDRLLNEIASSFEVIIPNMNTINRKLEESIAVGREFEPIAQLWGRFSSVMHAAGVPRYTGVGTGSGRGVGAGAAGATAAGGGDAQTGAGEAGAAGVGNIDAELFDDGLRSSRVIDPGLPPGVAPGGGQIYGR